jgi:PDZ and LIM domain protein 5/6/7
MNNNSNLVQVLSVKLQRNDSTVSWGFNVQGGRDFHSPLLIQKVTTGSLAEKASIIPGDFILRIGHINAHNLTHNQCRDAILSLGNHMDLILQR